MGARTEGLPPVQKASKQLLGAAYRLEIAAWISESGAAPINPTELTEQLTRISESPPRYTSVVQELNKLAESGLLVPLKSQVREVYFERRDSAFYEMCRRLRDEVRQGGELGPPGTLGQPEATRVTPTNPKVTGRTTGAA